MMNWFFKKDTYDNIQPRIGRIIATVLLVLVALIMFFGSFRQVGAGQVGVVTRFGAVNRVVSPGLNFKFPLVEGITIMDTRTQKEQVEASAASSDLQEVKSTIALNFHLNGKDAVIVYQNIGDQYLDRIVSPAMQEAFKATTAKFTASDLIAKREEVKVIAYQELSNRLGKYHIIVDDFNIVNFDFSADFNHAIEQKQVAQQNLEKAVTEAKTAKTQAEGQASAQKALKDNGSLTPEYLQFLAINKWDGQLPKATNGVPFIQIPTK